MSIKLIPPCTGKDSCAVFESPESLLDTLRLPHDFQGFMAAMEIVKRWKRCAGCPFQVYQSTLGDGEDLRKPLCSIAADPPYSMDAISRATGYSKTRVAQIEYTAVRKLKRVLGKVTYENEVLEKI